MTSEKPLSPRARDEVWRRLERTLDQVEAHDTAGRDRSVFVIRAAVLLLVVVGVGAAFAMWVTTPPAPTADQPATLSDLASRAADQAPYAGDLPSYLRVTDRVGGGTGIHESWLAEDGFGCFRSRPRGAAPSDLECGTELVLVGGFSRSDLRAVGEAADPVAHLESLLAATSPGRVEVDGPAVLVQVLARSGVEPPVRGAAFELLDRYGYELRDHGGPTLVVQGTGTIQTIYVDRDTTLVTGASATTDPLDWEFSTGHRAMPEP